MSSDFASRLSALRHEHGLSQKEVAARLGISPQSCSHYENGRRVPDIFMLYHFAKLYHVSMEYLLGETSEKISAFLPASSIRSLSQLSPEGLAFATEYLHFLAYRRRHSLSLKDSAGSHTLADRLQFHRKQTGLTQKEAACALHISTAAYSHYETGRHLPSPDLFMRIAELFQTTMEALLYDGKNSLRAFLSQTERLSPTEMRELEIFIDFLLGRETP